MSILGFFVATYLVSVLAIITAMVGLFVIAMSPPVQKWLVKTTYETIDLITDAFQEEEKEEVDD